MSDMEHSEAFTGLEAAIVLIAFVVVAAVFSYVVLGAGFFTTQQAQEVVYKSVDMSSSGLEILGGVYGNSTTIKTDNVAYIDGIRFVIGLTAGGTASDLASASFVFSTDETVINLKKSSKINHENSNITDDFDTVLASGDINTWYVINVDNGDPDALLENQKQYTIYLKLDEKAIAQNTRFNVDIIPASGAAYAVNRKAPARLKAVNVLN